MSQNLIDSYLALSQSSSRTQVLSTIQSIVNAPIDAFSAEEKQLLVQELLNDVKDAKGRIANRDVALALLALKTLGRNPTASRVIVTRSNLQILLNLVMESREQNTEAAMEALRCVANALLLIDTGRDTWVDIHGGETCVELLERSCNPQNIFLASRILFVITVKQTPFIRKLVEELHIVNIMSSRFDSLMGSILSGQAMAREAMVDLLKFTFNILLQYPRIMDADGKGKGKGKGKAEVSNEPKVMGEQWNDNLENLLPPLLRVFNSLPPTFPSPLAQPLTHVIHALINIPVAPLASRWFSPSSSPTSTPRSQSSDKFHKALSVLATGRRSLSSSRSSSPAPPISREPTVQHDTLQRAWDLFDITTAHYVPGDPDDISVRQLCKSEGVVLDDTLTPLVVLLTRLADGDESARLRMREWLLPSDLDRTKPLEEREDLLGRCIRLMSSVYFSRVKDSIGELLFIICNSDASTLAGQIGYGNCAGYLFNKGIMAPPPGATDSDGAPINPITGVRNPGRSIPEDTMTEEEKEREAEKLFILFDRLEKSGMAVNPVRKAQQEGRLEEIP